MSSSVPHLAAIVVAHDSLAHLERCLRSLEADVERIVVVDAGSTDGGPELVRSRFPAVELVELENVGYGRAANAGIERTESELVLVQNADAWAVDDAVAALTARMRETPRLGAAGPALVSLDGVTQPSYIPFPTPWWTGMPAVSSRPRRRQALKRPRAGRPSFVVGAVLLLRRAAIEEVGAFDPAFFMFNEDVDLCWRLVESGWEVRHVPEARFVHVGGGSGGGRLPDMYVEQVRGHVRFVAKHRGRRTARRARRVLTAAVRARAFVSPPEEADAYRAALEWLRSGEARRLA